MTISIYCKYNVAGNGWDILSAIAHEWGYDDGEWVETWRPATEDDMKFAAEWIPTDFPQSAKGYICHAAVEKNV